MTSTAQIIKFGPKAINSSAFATLCKAIEKAIGDTSDYLSANTRDDISFDSHAPNVPGTHNHLAIVSLTIQLTQLTSWMLSYKEALSNKRPLDEINTHPSTQIQAIQPINLNEYEDLPVDCHRIINEANSILSKVQQFDALLKGHEFSFNPEPVCDDIEANGLICLIKFLDN